jgi:O-antigen/teichoic acid export membrane protein
VRQRSFLNSVKWAYSANWGERAFSALFMFILAALLGPRDIGLLSIAVIYIAFLQMFLDQGLVAALIQKKNLDKEHLNAVFWMDLGLSLVLVAVSVLFGRWWARINHAPEAASLIFVLSLCIPIEGLAVVHKAMLSREMDFKSLSVRSNASVMLSGVVGIGMALLGFRSWSLVGQQIVKDLTALILLWKLSPWRPRLSFSFEHLRELMGFSISNFIAQLGVFVDSYASSVVLGLMFGPVAVGLYRLAERMVNSIIAATTGSIQWVSLPEFSRLQDNPDELRKSVITCIRLSSIVTLPVLACLGAVAAPLMIVVGPQWIPAIGILRVLCASGMIVSVSFFTGPLLQAMAKVKLAALLEWSRTLMGIAFLAMAGMLARNGSISIQVLAIAGARVMLGVCIVTPVFLVILLRLTRMSVTELISGITPSVCSAATIIAVVSLFHYSGIHLDVKPIVVLIAEVVIGSTTGIATLLYWDAHLRTSALRWVRLNGVLQE